MCMCAAGWAKGINPMLYYSCKLTQNLSANPGLQGKHVHEKTTTGKKVKGPFPAEPSVTAGLLLTPRSATVRIRGSFQMSSCRWNYIIVCLTL